MLGLTGPAILLPRPGHRWGPQYRTISGERTTRLRRRGRSRRGWGRRRRAALGADLLRDRSPQGKGAAYTEQRSARGYGHRICRWLYRHRCHRRASSAFRNNRVGCSVQLRLACPRIFPGVRGRHHGDHVRWRMTRSLYSENGHAPWPRPSQGVFNCAPKLASV